MIPRSIILGRAPGEAANYAKHIAAYSLFFRSFDRYPEHAPKLLGANSMEHFGGANSTHYLGVHVSRSPKSANIWSMLVKLGQYFKCFGQLWQTLTNVGSRLVNICPSCAKIHWILPTWS